MKSTNLRWIIKNKIKILHYTQIFSFIVLINEKCVEQEENHIYYDSVWEFIYKLES